MASEDSQFSRADYLEDYVDGEFENGRWQIISMDKKFLYDNKEDEFYQTINDPIHGYKETRFTKWLNLADNHDNYEETALEYLLDPETGDPPFVKAEGDDLPDVVQQFENIEVEKPEKGIKITDNEEDDAWLESENSWEIQEMR